VAIAEDLEHLGLAEHVSQFEDDLDADDLAEAAATLLDLVQDDADGPAFRLRNELLLLQQLVDEGSGVKPLDQA
jgi:hypothetical protein